VVVPLPVEWVSSLIPLLFQGTAITFTPVYRGTKMQTEFGPYFCLDYAPPSTYYHWLSARVFFTCDAPLLLASGIDETNQYISTI
jgi:hypothetical protein